MNKSEFKELRRTWRLATSCIVSPNNVMDWKGREDLAKKTWKILFNGIWKNMPEVIAKSVPIQKDHYHGHFGIRSKSKMACNMIHLPNSYPHKTRNP